MRMILKLQNGTGATGRRAWDEMDTDKLGDIPSYGPEARELGEAYGEGEYLCLDTEQYEHPKLVKVRAVTNYEQDDEL